jgi:hypothetical protein
LLLLLLWLFSKPLLSAIFWLGGLVPFDLHPFGSFPFKNRPGRSISDSPAAVRFLRRSNKTVGRCAPPFTVPPFAVTTLPLFTDVEVPPCIIGGDDSLVFISQDEV